MEYIYLGFFITFFFLFFILTSGKVDYFSPLSLHVVSWFFVFFIGLLVGDQFYPLTDHIFYCFMIWFCVLTFSFLLMYFSQIKMKKIDYKYELKYQKTYIILSIFACVILIGEIFYVGMGGPYNFFLNLRLSLFVEEYEGVRYAFAPYLYLIMTPIFAISLLCENTKSLRKVAILWQVLFVVATVGKLSLLSMFMIFLVVKYLGYKEKINIIKMGFVALLFLCFSFLINFVRMSDGDGLDLIEMLGIYIYSPIIALGELPIGNGMWGEYTFRLYYAITYKLGLSDYPPVVTVLDYVYVPIPTNVYTIMQPFYQDFGYYGVFYAAIFYGFLYSILYFQAIKKGGVYIILYSIFSVILVFSFMGETLFTNLALNIYLIFFSIVLWRSSVVKR